MDEPVDKLRRSLVHNVIQGNHFELAAFEEKTLEDFPTNGRNYLDLVYINLNLKLSNSVEKAYMPRWLIALEDKLTIEEMQGIFYLHELKASDLLSDKEPPWSKETQAYICNKISFLSVKSREFFNGVFVNQRFHKQRFLKHSTGHGGKDAALLELALSMAHKDS